VILAVEPVNRREADRYVQRVSDRWPLQRAILSGARIDELLDEETDRIDAPYSNTARRREFEKD